MIPRLTRSLATGAVALAVSTALAGPVTAQGVPTVDTQNIAQEIRQLQQMLQDFGIQTDLLDNALEQLDVVQNQLDQLQQMHASLTGPRSILGMVMGDGLDGLLEAKFRDLPGLIRGIQAGDWSNLLGVTAGPMRTQMEQALARAGFDENSLREIATSGKPGAEGVATRATTGAVMSAAAQNSHAEAAQSLERVERLVAKIPEMEDLKAAMDHNTRVTAELAIAMTRMWELEAIQTLGAGNAGVVDAATIAEERRYMDFTLPSLRP
ncbi:type IV secretion system protein [Rhodovulum steppense]|uniref:Type IV secretion system protein VirB5 n=1 Tax=Rhodovulum steppense TaxID=540251 RepID=A0A4R1YXI6_9RHOB|nr:type IV secretion system protein [Rhodovulum steppense]TCM85493.1 type IV secretion system protein VirB5 [Rhodovulum steppense]